MGILDFLASKTEEIVRENYRRATGRSYQRDFRHYRFEYGYKLDNELEMAWNRMYDDRSMETLPERMAIRSLMKERGIEFDDY